MSGTLLLLDLAGYVGLLLWGTHMVTSGVQRGFGSELRGWLGRNLQDRWRAFLAGLGITAVLQSSTATGLMATSFTASGLLCLESGLAVMLGANVGTTLIAQVLSFDIGPIAPPLILAGVLTFRRSHDDRTKNLGRVGIGLGLMLLALAGLVHSLAAAENGPGLEVIIRVLSGAPILLVILGAVITWACHSSVAVVLLVVSLAATHTIGVAPALALVLGANVGSTVAPLMEAGSPLARRLPLGNLLIRLCGCLVALPSLPLCAELLTSLHITPARSVVSFHTAFNLALAAAFILTTEGFARLLTWMLPEPQQPADPGQPIYLDLTALDSAAVALTNASRETLRMMDTVKAMLLGAMELLQGDRRVATQITNMGRTVERLGGEIRRYLADLGNEQPLDDEEEGARAQEILSAVINLEHIGNIIDGSLVELAVKRIINHPLAAEESRAVVAMHGELLVSLQLAVSVFLTGNKRDAARLRERKAAVRRMEADATALHVRLLRSALRVNDVDRVSFVAEGSGLFLRLVGDLRRMHSHIVSFAYPALRPEASRPALSGVPSKDDDGPSDHHSQAA